MLSTRRCAVGRDRQVAACGPVHPWQAGPGRCCPGRRVACRNPVEQNRRSAGRLAGPRLLVGSFGDAGCPLGGSRAVWHARRVAACGRECMLQFGLDSWKRMEPGRLGAYEATLKTYLNVRVKSDTAITVEGRSVILNRNFMKFWRRFSGFNWKIMALILAIIFIDIFIYKMFITDQSAFDDRLKIITALAQITSIAIAALAISYQVQSTKEREIQFKIHQQRKETYEDLLKVLEKIIKLSKEKDPELISKMEPDWRELRPKLIIYASPEVIAAYKAIEHAGLETRSDAYAPVRRIAELYLQMRSEVGFAAEDVPTRQLLSFIITDINESQYNILFDNDGYLK